ncbi:uncharacterized protein MONBRDRAFT_27450 [Monosiga brevicollis MX1]|uniref:Amino acid transporter n=1 Tax=Monosiga brevicollis TaxID=81824 RepID=A9V5B1_MONBE|nr:uncharacterized protein MONBRDRAFT_27450 [Monosiga brevicollis MX1]EDQ87248.1 predicted protein [Monosiga brevicollis MX1]|eukprot:XP_001747861.1 hypothetical protein [Monosiga brevicollis MX1]
MDADLGDEDTVPFLEQPGIAPDASIDGDVNIQVQLEPPRSLTLTNAITFVVGTMIGSGIFASPGSVLVDAKSAGMAFIAWIVAGLVALMGSACYAELGTLLPANGAEYTYINAGLHPVVAFLFTWTSSVVTRPGSQAIMILIAGEYLCKALSGTEFVDEWTFKGVAVALNTVVLLINCWSSRWGAWLQDSTTAIKVMALVLISLLGLAWLAHFAQDPDSAAYRNLHGDNAFSSDRFSIGLFGLAVVNALFSYDGWNNANFCVAEMVNPARDLPRALVIGIPLVVVIYVFANLAYFAVLDLDSIADLEAGKPNESFASTFARVTMGRVGGVILPLLIFASAFGATNGSLYTAARLHGVGHMHAKGGGRAFW